MEAKYGLSRDFIFKDAVRFLKGKRALTSEEYRLLDDESRAKAFTVSGYTSIQMLQEFLDCLTKAAEEGTTKEQFLKDMNNFLEEHGYEGMNPWKSDNIFRTNMQTAFNAGHYKSMTDETTKKMRPYWQYKTAGDGHVRETHQAMAERVFPADDPIWGDNIGNPSLGDDYWGGSIPFNHPGMKASVQWLEIVLGVKVRIYKNFNMGWSVRMKYKTSASTGEYGDPW